MSLYCPSWSACACAKNYTTKTRQRNAFPAVASLVSVLVFSSLSPADTWREAGAFLAKETAETWPGKTAGTAYNTWREAASQRRQRFEMLEKQRRTAEDSRRKAKREEKRKKKQSEGKRRKTKREGARTKMENRGSSRLLSSATAIG
ncbi:hypothetical protein TGPRC2_301218 [Toxoplasma gondii TgCatPRC2]|uniref:Uncharacterized protein n=4 Tax=Toxoplasma gondii TaxID=5811 RepID=S7VPV7_TOXGG|nr:hypothetical protein TGME49_301218 [Toxoplasma gondii ME49]EPR57189.1 hypothetical protein TGGT1_301218 [Toxoplasma gondii GT1]EPT31328.1 hypothetical protein TGME49_301218 [Toxoplasma gondii ME49]KAF4645161.1 hypothetical protein TGRH88_009780 [Toxoplasma gondii]KYK63223.1 hypothetical protein TGPRC2_301218 [Toxoplasma gondii TgCatPRC2]|eukprot:XP_018637945.1 hypothetical protein TGME49_301218 [Toxoplasma gondii ME49]